MKYVIDCSVAFMWVVPEPLSPQAEALREDFRNQVHELLAPDLFPTEIANALIVAERRGRLLAGRSTILFSDVAGPRTEGLKNVRVCKRRVATVVIAILPH
jgi:predicted nucleic acid-binding protein